MTQIKNFISDNFAHIFNGEYLNAANFSENAWDYYERDCDAFGIETATTEDEFKTVAKTVYSELIGNYYTIRQWDAEGTTDDPTRLSGYQYEFFGTKEAALADLAATKDRLSKGTICLLEGETLYVNADGSDRLEFIFEIKDLSHNA